MQLGLDLSIDLRLAKRAVFLLFIGLLVIIMLGATTEKTVYSHISNKVLKQKSLQLVQDIRRLVDSYQKKGRRVNDRVRQKRPAEYE